MVGFLLALGALVAALPVSPARAETEECLGCHAPEEDMVDTAFQVDPKGWNASVHAEAGFECTDCHEDKGDFPHEEGAPKVRCAQCHEDAADEFGGVHAESIRQAKGGESRTTPFDPVNPCVNCHGEHDVRAVDDPLSRVYFRNVPGTCSTCHGDLKIMRAAGLTNGPADSYSKSVHGLCLKDPDKKPAVCTACHGPHDIEPANNPRSKINPFNISRTCGECHRTEREQYDSSVHGRAFQRGVTTAPVCTSCHGIHSIKMVNVEEGDEREKSLARTTCPACHNSAALMSEFDIAPSRVKSYRASYHGLVTARGGARAADCASCHGIHAIYPSSDPRSSVNPENLDRTCGKCHPGAKGQFARYPVHFDESLVTSTGEKVVVWVKRIYWVLLVGVLGGMFLHNLIIFLYYVRKKWRAEKKEPSRLRFSRSEVLQHSLFVMSFLLLAFTGFMLAYPNSWYSQILAHLGFTEELRRWVHRASAVVMVSVSLFHVGWVLSSSYGRKEIRRVAPRLRDAREMLQNLRYHLGSSDLPAAFGKFDYPAKAEYWALVWGTLVMALTGAMLWFPVFTSTFLPAWTVKVAQVIHLFEAWLATLAILIFHFFYVVFHPEVYPLSFAMWHGRMPRRLAEEHHPRWSEDEDAPPKAPAEGEQAS